MNTERNLGNLIQLGFKGVAVAMGIAVIVLQALGTASAATTLTLLAIGLTCLAISSLQRPA